MENITEVKKFIEDFFSKTTIPFQKIEVQYLKIEDRKETLEDDGREEGKRVLEIKVTTPEPQILIGQKGETLFEIQNLLRVLIFRQTDEFCYVDLDINDYKKKKIEYLKRLAKESADEVVLTKREKALPPMSAFERRIIHLELSKRAGVTTQSEGEEGNRKVVIKPI